MYRKNYYSSEELYEIHSCTLRKRHVIANGTFDDTSIILNKQHHLFLLTQPVFRKYCLYTTTCFDHHQGYVQKLKTQIKVCTLDFKFTKYGLCQTEHVVFFV
jgi:hypothetical protein